MRRKDREIVDKNEIEEILSRSEVIRIALVDEGEPYLVAMNYAYLNEVIYLHSANEGRKVEIIKKSPSVAFLVDVDAEIYSVDNSSKCSSRYRSVFGTGKASFVEVREEKKLALDALMCKHTDQVEFSYPDALFERTLIIKIVIDEMTGKKAGY